MFFCAANRKTRGGEGWYLSKMFKNFLNWMIPCGPLGLLVMSFAESSFFPIPPDILLIALAVINPSRALFLALLTTVGSVLGAMFGYFLGVKGGRPILKKFVSAKKIALVESYYKKYDVWAVGVAGFTPIPYKIFTISAGAFSLDLTRFILVSILARGGRFFIVGGAIYFFGEKITNLIEKYTNIFSIAFVALLIGGFYAVKKLADRHKRLTENKS
jgi:membrane protein YqaA with SNARE-associated domain